MKKIQEIFGYIIQYPELRYHYDVFLDVLFKEANKERLPISLFIPPLIEAFDNVNLQKPIQKLTFIANHQYLTESKEASLLNIDPKTGQSILEEINATTLTNPYDIKETEESLRKGLSDTLVHIFTTKEIEKDFENLAIDPTDTLSKLLISLSTHPKLSDKKSEGLTKLFDNFDIHTGKRIPLGITPLDRILEDGIGVGTVTLLSGATNVGKSWTALHCLMANAANGSKSMYLSKEDNTPLIRGRMFAYLLQLSTRLVKKLSPEELQKKVSMKVDQLNKSDSKNMPGNGYRNNIYLERLMGEEMTPLLIDERIQRIKNETGEAPSLIALDYLQIAKANGGIRRGELHTNMIERFIRELQEVNIKHKCSTILVSQGKGASVGKGKVNLQDSVAGSYSALQACDYAIFIGRSQEETDRLTEEIDKNPRLSLELMKSKDTSLGKIYSHTNLRKTEFNYFGSIPERDQFLTENPYTTN